MLAVCFFIVWCYYVGQGFWTDSNSIIRHLHRNGALVSQVLNGGGAVIFCFVGFACAATSLYPLDRTPLSTVSVLA